jgi:hypothetical protein
MTARLAEDEMTAELDGTTGAIADRIRTLYLATVTTS